ncbi:MAG: threonylcarbamoyl-AMP synthase [Rhodobiaceae bacterium]|nr:threonylcarbamoyl-AMP synthase [Rhodobiaceae bacterium]MCC0051237.1 threonylcarbamoyl-AMP synthase [Rhodobiaceae bacterium]MCC0059914.1 threonylcarbamoyl-AMP synthase [Rhodobiaceae bacterium]
MTAPEILDANDPSAITDAAAILKAGELVSFPTETVYGLGADAANARAVAKIYSAKGRPSFNPLIAHLADRDAAQRQGLFNTISIALADRFWPGPLTLVVPRSSTATVSDLATAGLDSVALRVPDNAVAHALLSAFGGPVVAPSANRSGYVSATTAQHVATDLGDTVSIILDAGPTGIGIESTVVDCTGETARILRPGAVTRAAIREAIGDALIEDNSATGDIVAPGMLASHYAPNARVRLNAADVHPGEAVITISGFQPAGIEQAKAVFDLSPSGDLEEAAANLFTALRKLDEAASEGIAICPIPEAGLGEAINDRLRRAAAPRDS